MNLFLHDELLLLLLVHQGSRGGSQGHNEGEEDLEHLSGYYLAMGHNEGEEDLSPDRP